MVSWEFVEKVMLPLIAAVLAQLITTRSRKGPRLITFMPNLSYFTLANPQGSPLQVGTHAIVIGNAGRKTTHNVRIGHNAMPANFELTPRVAHTMTPTPGGGAEILIPSLVPKEQVQISYLYTAPLNWNAIHSYVKSDDGLAEYVRVIPRPPPTKWRYVNFAIWWIGLFACIYAGLWLLSGLWLIGVPWLARSH